MVDIASFFLSGSPKQNNKAKTTTTTTTKKKPQQNNSNNNNNCNINKTHKLLISKNKKHLAHSDFLEQLESLI